MAGKVLHHEWKGENCLGAISKDGNKRGIFFTLATDCKRLLQGSNSINRMVFHNDHDFIAETKYLKHFNYFHYRWDNFTTQLKRLICWKG